MPLKIIWAVLDAFTIVVIGSGLYLWLSKRRRTRRGLRLLVAAQAGRPAE